MARSTPALVLLVLFIFTLVPAQVAPKKNSAPAKNTSLKPAKTAEPEVDVAAEQRRIQAISLLSSLADEARSFRDQGLRSRVEARAADALWETEPDKARALFYRAWEDAEAGDAEAARRESEDMRRQMQTMGNIIRRRPRDLRSEVLRLAAKRDRDLGEELLKKLSESSERETKEATEANRLDSASAPIAAAKRLQLARQLLQDNEVERALQIAAPALVAVNREVINFLSALRQKNVTASDQAYLGLLTRAAMDPTSDANTVSGLSSYPFTPFLYVTFSPDGGVNMQQERADVIAPPLTRSVSEGFFRVAVDILLRPLPAADQDTTTSGRVGKYMVIKRLLPLFESLASERAQLLKTQLAALSPDVPPAERNANNRGVTRGILPEDTSRNSLDAMQERLDRAQTAEQRDAIYADYAVALAGKGDSQSRDLVDKIENAELRKRVRGYIDFQLVQQAVQKNDAAETARLAKNGELTSVQRIWAYSRAARIFMKSDQPRALELLEEAAAETRRMSAGSADRPRSLVAVATLLLQADRVRGWEVTSEMLKAANAAEGFTGEEANVSATLRTPQMVVVTNAAAEEFDLLGLFRTLAKDDFLRAIEIARSFSADAPRAAATIAIARSVLEKAPAESASLN